MPMPRLVSLELEDATSRSSSQKLVRTSKGSALLNVNYESRESALRRCSPKGVVSNGYKHSVCSDSKSRAPRDYFFMRFDPARDTLFFPNFQDYYAFREHYDITPEIIPGADFPPISRHGHDDHIRFTHIKSMVLKGFIVKCLESELEHQYSQVF